MAGKKKAVLGVKAEEAKAAVAKAADDRVALKAGLTAKQAPGKRPY